MPVFSGNIFIHSMKT